MLQLQFALIKKMSLSFWIFSIEQHAFELSFAIEETGKSMQSFNASFIKLGETNTGNLSFLRTPYLLLIFLITES
jgi:hypothetical protein